MTTISNIQMRKVKLTPHWYKRYIRECPVCGRRDSWLERVYGDKPTDPAELVDYQEQYDRCEEREW